MQQPIHPFYLHIEKNLQALWEQLNELKLETNNRLFELESENKQLLARLDQLKPIMIENLNYKIQELTVENLSGTLHIGMSGLTNPDEMNKWLNENVNSDSKYVEPSADHPADGLSSSDYNGTSNNNEKDE